MRASSNAAIWLFLIAFALVFYGMGASFVESFVNYPTWRLIGANEFRAYHQALGQLSADGLSLPLIERLIFTNWWFRKVPQIINGVLFLWMMALLFRVNSLGSGHLSERRH